MPTLPDVVKQIGVTTMKRSPDLMMIINLVSPDGRYDQLYLSNYMLIQVRDEIARLEGVGDAMIFGQRDYSMRVWLDPDLLAMRNLTAGDVVRALREQNVQVAAGPDRPAAGRQGRRLPVHDDHAGPADRAGAVRRHHRQDRRRRPNRPPQRRGAGRTGRRRTRTSTTTSTASPPAGMGVFQLPGSNALETAERVKAKMDELSKRFPEGVEYRHLLRHDALHQRVDPGSVPHAARRRAAGGHGRARVPAKLAFRADSA